MHQTENGSRSGCSPIAKRAQSKMLMTGFLVLMNFRKLGVWLSGKGAGMRGSEVSGSLAMELPSTVLSDLNGKLVFTKSLHSVANWLQAGARVVYGGDDIEGMKKICSGAHELPSEVKAQLDALNDLKAGSATISTGRGIFLPYWGLRVSGRASPVNSN